MLKLRSWIYNIIIYMNAAVLLLMFILLVIQVFYRKWLNDPLTWSEEIAILTMVWITFVGAYQCTAEDSHLKMRSEEHTSELQSRFDLVCRLLLEKKKKSIRSCSWMELYSTTVI